MTTPKKSTPKTGNKLTKDGELKPTTISAIRTASTKALKKVHAADAKIQKALGVALTASKDIDKRLKLQVGNVALVVVVYIKAVNGFNKTLKTGSKDRIGLTYIDLRNHVKALTGNRPEGGSINTIIRLGIESALTFKNAPRVFKMNTAGELIANNNVIYPTVEAKGENTKTKIKNTYKAKTVVPQKEISSLYKQFNPDVKKGADKKKEEKTKAKKEASELASRLASVEEMRVVDLVAALKGQKTNGTLSLEALSVNQLKNVLAFVNAIKPFQDIAKSKSFDTLTQYLQSLIRTNGEVTNVTSNEPKLVKGGAKKKQEIRLKRVTAA